MALLAFSPLRFISTAITALAPTKLIYASSLTSLGLGSILLLVMVPLFGIWGVIGAMAIQQAVVNSLNFYIFRKM
jgi:O-antigen/teichoic acid export membrane protein